MVYENIHLIQEYSVKLSCDKGWEESLSKLMNVEETLFSSVVLWIHSTYKVDIKLYTTCKT